MMGDSEASCFFVQCSKKIGGRAGEVLKAGSWTEEPVGAFTIDLNGSGG